MGCEEVLQAAEHALDESASAVIDASEEMRCSDLIFTSLNQAGMVDEQGENLLDHKAKVILREILENGKGRLDPASLYIAIEDGPGRSSRESQRTLTLQKERRKGISPARKPEVVDVSAGGMSRSPSAKVPAGSAAHHRSR
jgi:hypothetical protein